MRHLRFLFRAAGVLLLALWVIFDLSGCAPPQDARAAQLREGFSQSYRADLSVTAGGLALSAALSRPDPASCTVEITAPPNLAGLTYRLHADGVDITYRELSFTAQALPASPLLQAVPALSELFSPESEALPHLENGFWALSDGTNTLLLEEESGAPAKLLLDHGNVEIVLENFVFYG